MWNTVSPAVQISAGVGGKRNLRWPSSPPPSPSNTYLSTSESQWIHFTQQPLNSVPVASLGGTMVSLTLIWRNRLLATRSAYGSQGSRGHLKARSSSAGSWWGADCTAVSSQQSLRCWTVSRGQLKSSSLTDCMSSIMPHRGSELPRLVKAHHEDGSPRSSRPQGHSRSWEPSDGAWKSWAEQEGRLRHVVLQTLGGPVRPPPGILLP